MARLAIAPEYTDSQLTWGSGTPADGVFFDTARGDSFLSLHYPTAPELVVSEDSVEFSSATLVDLHVVLKDPSGNALNTCFDNFVVEAHFDVMKYIAPNSEGWVTGFYTVGNGRFGAYVPAFPGYLDYIHPYNMLNDTAWNTVGDNNQIVTSLPAELRCEVVEDVLKVTITMAGDTHILPDVVMPYVASSISMPDGFQTLGVIFSQAVCNMNYLRISAAFPNATYAFVGDSLTQGRFASTYPESFVQLVRAQNVDQVICCGASGSVIPDWLDSTHAVKAMRPKYVFLLMGTNDIQLGSSVNTVVSQHQQLMSELTSGGAMGVCISIYPAGNLQVPDVNAQLQAIYPRYIDVYSLLQDGSTLDLNPLYDWGDGIHLNSAGNAVVANAVLAAITANGWT